MDELLKKKKTWHQLKKLNKRYLRVVEQICKCDETGLEYKGWPNKTNDNRNETTIRKIIKERVL